MVHPGHRTGIVVRVALATFLILLTVSGFASALHILPAAQSSVNGSKSSTVGLSNSTASQSIAPQTVGADPVSRISLPETIVSGVNSALASAGVVEDSSANPTLYNQGLSIRLLGGPLSSDELLTSSGKVLSSYSLWSVQVSVSGEWLPLLPLSSTLTVIGTNSTGAYAARTMPVAAGNYSGTFTINYWASSKGPLKWDLQFAPAVSGDYRMQFAWSNITNVYDLSTLSKKFNVSYGVSNYTFSWDDVSSLYNVTTSVVTGQFLFSLDLGSVVGGSRVDVDPSLVASGAYDVYTSQRLVFYDPSAGYYFVFYCGTSVGVNDILYSYSSNGTSWSAGQTITPAQFTGTLGCQGEMSVSNVGQAVVLGWANSVCSGPLASCTSDQVRADYIIGTISGSRITWSSIQNPYYLSFTCPSSCFAEFNSITVASGGHVALSFYAVSQDFVHLDCNSTLYAIYSISQSYPKVWKADTDSNDCGGASLSDMPAVIVPSDSQGDVRIIYQKQIGGASSTEVSLWSEWYDNSSLGSPEELDSNVVAGDEFSAASDLSYNIHVAWLGASDGKVSYAYRGPSSSSWTIEKNIFSQTVTYPTLTVDLSTSDVYALGINGSSIVMKRKTLSSAWSDVSPVFPVIGRSSPVELSSNFASASAAGSSYLAIIWREGNGLWFAAIPIETVWSPYASPTDPWDGNGVAPYGQYFANLGEYVSPSTGMLTVEQTDLSVPGRGLALDITRVYTEPYSFLNCSTTCQPYLYDLYPWAPMGDGWALNFPWMSTSAQPSDVHLSDGQGYLIPSSFWSGSTGTYQNYQGESFQLVRTVNGTIVLVDKSGTSYTFGVPPNYPNRALRYITDSTGNSTITFFYNANGQISCISDTVGRAFSFSYSGGLLHQISQINGSCGSPGSSIRRITYGNYGASLTSVTDPANRNTTFTRGSNPWLIAQIIYPTGGFDDYAYTRYQLGTQATTYRVHQQTVIASSTLTVRWDAYSYTQGAGDRITGTTVTDGNGTGTKIASYTKYAFSFIEDVKNVTDASGNLLSGDDQFFGVNGQIIKDVVLVNNGQGQIGSYTNYYSYDLRGNQIYAKKVINPSTNTYQESFNAYYNDGLSPGFRSFQETFSQDGGNSTDNVWQTSAGSWSVSSGDYNGTYVNGPLINTFSWANSSSHDVSIQARVYLAHQINSTAQAGIFVHYPGTGDEKWGFYLLTGMNEKEVVLSDDGYIIVGSSCPLSTITGYWYTFNMTSLGASVTAWLKQDGQSTLCQTSNVFQNSPVQVSTGFGLATGGFSALFDNVTVTTVSPYITTTGFSNSFYQNGAPSPSIHNALAGTAQLQNGTGSAPIEIYFDYYLWGGLNHARKMWNTGSSIQWLTTITTYDQYGNPTVVRSPQGRQNFYAYNSNNNIYQNAYLTNHTQILTGPSTKITTLYSYNLTTGSILQETDPNGNITSYTNDNLGRTTSITYPAGLGYVKYAYNDQLNYVNVTNENGWFTRQIYDGLGRLSTVERLLGGKFYSNSTTTYNWVDEPVNQTDPLSRTTTSQYDAAGRLTTVIEADGNRTGTTYNMANSWIISSDQYGNLKCEVYDRLGRLISVVEESSSSCTGIVTNYYYDEMGNLVKVVNSKNQTTRYSYDDLNRLVTTTYPDGSKESYQYDNDGLLIGKVDRMGVGTSYLYDSLGHLTNFQYPWMSYQESDNYTYDKNGNMMSLVSLNATTSYSFDARNRVLGEAYNVNSVVQSGGGGGGGGSVAEGTLITLANDTAVPVQSLSAGMQLLSYNVTTHRYASSTITRMAVVYTSNMLVIRTTDPLPLRVDNATAQKLYVMKSDGSIGWFSVTELRVGDSLFNGVDLKWSRVADIEYASGGIHKMYDIYTSAPFDYLANNYLDPPKIPSGPSTPSGVVSQNYSVKYAYKGENTMSIIYCAAACGTSSPVVNYTYDDLGRTISVDQGASSYVSLYYYQNDEVKSITYGNNLLGNYTYDKLSRVSTISLKTSGNHPTTLLSLAYGYNKTGTVASVVGQSTANTGSNITVNEQYAYDPLQRVNSASLTSGSSTTKFSYLYDNLGNRIFQNINGATYNYTYNNLNEITSETRPQTVFNYDKNGELTLRNQTATPVLTGSCIWNHKGELLQFWLNGAVQASYAYDGMHRQVESKEGSSVVFRAYLGTESLMDINYTSGSVIDYVYAQGMRIAKYFVGGTVNYYHQDALGSTRLVTSSTGSILFSDNYQPFGLDNSSTGKEAYKFTGKPYSQAAQLYYYYQRWYDPTTGRFISQDPLAGHLSDPQSLNPYIYATDQPTGITDPSGMDGCGIFSSVCSFVSSGATTAWNGLTTVGSDIGNGWNSLSPEEQQGLMLAGFVALTFATGGTDLLVIGGIGAAAAVGGYLGGTYAAGGTPTLAGALMWANVGFGVTTGIDSLAELGAGGGLNVAERLAANRAAGLEYEGQIADTLGLTRNIGVGRTILQGAKTAGSAVPDFVTDAFVGEAKFTQSTVYATRQIRIEIEGAAQAGKAFNIFVPEGTRVADSVFEYGVQFGVKVLKIPFP